MPRSPGSALLQRLLPILFVACGPQYVSRSQQVPAQGANARIVAQSPDLRELDAMEFFHRPLMARLGAFGIAGIAYYDDTRIVIDTPERDPEKLARAVRALSSAGYYVIRDGNGSVVTNFQVRLSAIVPPTPECACIADWIVEIAQPVLLRGPLVVSIGGKDVDIPLVKFVESNALTYALEVRLETVHQPILDELMVAFAGPPIPGLYDAKLQAATGGAP